MRGLFHNLIKYFYYSNKNLLSFLYNIKFSIKTHYENTPAVKIKFKY